MKTKSRPGTGWSPAEKKYVYKYGWVNNKITLKVKIWSISMVIWQFIHPYCMHVRRHAHTWTYLHVRCVPLAVSPGSGHWGESAICMVKFPTLEIQEECCERLLRIREKRKKILLSTHINAKTSIKNSCYDLKQLQGKFHWTKIMNLITTSLLWSIFSLQFEHFSMCNPVSISYLA